MYYHMVGRTASIYLPSIPYSLVNHPCQSTTGEFASNCAYSPFNGIRIKFLEFREQPLLTEDDLKIRHFTVPEQIFVQRFPNSWILDLSSVRSRQSRDRYSIRNNNQPSDGVHGQGRARASAHYHALKFFFSAHPSRV